MEETVEFKEAIRNANGSIDCQINHSQYGWIPITLDPSDPSTQNIFYQVDVSGEVKPYEPPSDVEVQKALSEGVNLERDRRVKQGGTFNVSGVGDIPIKGDDQTVRNLQGLAVAGQLRMSQGFTDFVTTFRDANNVIHQMTDPQIIELWSKGSSYVSQCFQASWALKDQPSIPEDYQEDTYWP